MKNDETTEEDIEETTDDKEEEPGEYTIDNWLADLLPGRTLVITRLQPEWARGRLEEIPIPEQGPPLDIEKIRDRWGGYQLSLRVREPGGTLGKAHHIDMFSFPPLIYGEPVENPSSNPWTRKKNDTRQFIVSPPQPEKPAKDIGSGIVEMMGKMMASQQALFTQLLTSQTQPQRPPKDATFQAMGDALGLLKALQAMTASQQPSTPNLDGVDGIGALMPLLSALFSKDDKPKLTSPKQSSNNSEDIIQKIVSGGPNQVASFAASLMQAIPNDEQREAAIDSFFNLAKIDIEGDDDNLEDDEGFADDSN